MSDIVVHLGHPTLTLRDLAPAKNPAFSPNLYAWMKRHAHFYSDGGVVQSVYRALPGSRVAEDYGAGTLFIGHPYHAYPGDTDFSGGLMMAALCEGAAAKTWCYRGYAPGLEKVEDFWDCYLKVGRCAIDPAHRKYFISSAPRYSESGDIRTCLWCGAQHKKIITPRIVEDESWVPV